MLSPPHQLLIRCAYKKTLRIIAPVKSLRIKIMLTRLLPLLLNTISLWLSVPPSPVVPHVMCMPMLMKTLILLNYTTIPLTLKCHPLILMSPLTSIQQFLRSRRLILVHSLAFLLLHGILYLALVNAHGHPSRLMTKLLLFLALRQTLSKHPNLHHLAFKSPSSSVH